MLLQKLFYKFQSPIVCYWHKKNAINFIHWPCNLYSLVLPDFCRLLRISYMRSYLLQKKTLILPHISVAVFNVFFPCLILNSLYCHTVKVADLFFWSVTSDTVLFIFKKVSFSLFKKYSFPLMFMFSFTFLNICGIYNSYITPLSGNSIILVISGSISINWLFF